MSKTMIAAMIPRYLSLRNDASGHAGQAWRDGTSTRRRMWSVVFLTASAPILGMIFMSASASRPNNLGAITGRLAPCPESSNAVSTQTAVTRHRIEPLRYEGSGREAMARLRSVIESMPRATVVHLEAQYLHAEFVSRVFRFVDDVEFVLEEEFHRIHFRSASRVGYYDMGVNRNRMESIRKAFEAADR